MQKFGGKNRARSRRCRIIRVKRREDNINEHNHGTVCGAWWTGPIYSDGTPNGYGVYEVSGDAVTWYYKSTQHPKDHQIRIYAKGRSGTAQDEIAVNVWNWDPKWKIEGYEDDAFKGVMEQRVAMDPWAIELYGGAELPVKHKFVDPSPSDHLFFAKPSINCKQIRVRATDRFGNIYEERLSIS